MKVSETKLRDLLILEPCIFTDNRGLFCENFNQKVFDNILTQHNQQKVNFVQDNFSISKKNVLRGLHCQTEPHSQAKLVQVIQGRIWDVVVDLRKHSSTFKQWMGIELSASNKKQIWIPTGFAHGFLSLENNTMVFYKTTNYYSKEKEYCISWKDPELNISWPIESCKVIQQSLKDETAPNLRNSPLLSLM